MARLLVVSFLVMMVVATMAFPQERGHGHGHGHGNQGGIQGVDIVDPGFGGPSGSHGGSHGSGGIQGVDIVDPGFGGPSGSHGHGQQHGQHGSHHHGGYRQQGY